MSDSERGKKYSHKKIEVAIRGKLYCRCIIDCFDIVRQGQIWSQGLVRWNEINLVKFTVSSKTYNVITVNENE